MKKEIVRKTLILVSIFLFINVIINPIITGSNFNDDTTPPITTLTLDHPTPIIEVTWETYELNGTWYVDFNCSFDDNESGIHRVAWYLNGVEQDSMNGPGPYYGFHFTVKLSIAKKCVFKFVAYYGDGFSAFVEVDGKDIKSVDCLDCPSNGKTHLAEKIVNIYSHILDIKSAEDCECREDSNVLEDDYPILCEILLIKMMGNIVIYLYLVEIAYKIWPISYELATFIEAKIASKFYYKAYEAYKTAESYNCSWIVYGL